MRVQQAVTYFSLAVILLTALVVGSTPFRFPGSTIAWTPMMTFISPAIVLMVLLLVRPLLPLRAFRTAVAIVAVLGVGLTMVGWIPLFLLCFLLIGLAALYIQRGLHDRS